MLKFFALCLFWLVLLAGCASTPSTPSLSASQIERRDFLARDWIEQTRTLEAAIRNRDFDQVSSALDLCMQYVPNDPELESRCYDYMTKPVALDMPFLDALSAWVDQDPTNYPAMVLMSEAESLKAWVTRGHGYRNNTHPYYLELFNRGMQSSTVYLQQAINLRPDLPFGYASILNRYSRMSNEYDEELQRWYDRAERQVPTSLLISKIRIDGLQPRWGGSYEAMESVYQDYVNASPELAKSGRYSFQELRDYMDLIRARDSKDGIGTSQDYVAALNLMEPMAERGYNWGHLYLYMAQSYQALGRDEDAYRTARKALEVAPFSDFVLGALRCDCYGQSMQEALDIGRAYTKRYPSSYQGWSGLGWLYYEDEQWHSALEAFNRALDIRPHMARAHQAVGWVQDKLSIEHDDYFTVPLKKDVVMFSFPGFKIMADVRQQLKDNIGAQLSGQDRVQFMDAVDAYFTDERFSGAFRQRLDGLNFTTVEWTEVSTYFAERAHVAQHMKPSYREEILRKYEDSDEGSPVGQVFVTATRTAQSMIEAFLSSVS